MILGVFIFALEKFYALFSGLINYQVQLYAIIRKINFILDQILEDNLEIVAINLD